MLRTPGLRAHSEAADRQEDGRQAPCAARSGPTRAARAAPPQPGQASHDAAATKHPRGRPNSSPARSSQPPDRPGITHSKRPSQPPQQSEPTRATTGQAPQPRIEPLNAVTLCERRDRPQRLAGQRAGIGLCSRAYRASVNICSTGAYTPVCTGLINGPPCNATLDLNSSAHPTHGKEKPGGSLLGRR